MRRRRNGCCLSAGGSSFTPRAGNGTLAQRVDGEPPDLPAEFRHWTLRQAAEARLAASDFPVRAAICANCCGRNSPTRKPSRTRAGSSSAAICSKTILLDAQAGVLRYQQDYNAKSDAWQVLHAEILLRAEDYRGAFEVLTGVETAEARLLRQLAGLRAKFYKPQDVLKGIRPARRRIQDQPRKSAPCAGHSGRSRTGRGR